MNRLEDDWFGPQVGLLAKNKPMPAPPLDNDWRKDWRFNPNVPRPPPPSREYREGIDPIPNAGPLKEQPTIRGLNEALQQPYQTVDEDMGKMSRYPTPGEYLPLPGEELTLGDIIQRFSPRRSGSF